MTPFREQALIASMSSPDAAVQAWEGVIGAEGRLTGDGREIDADALVWAAFPLPLRYAQADFGEHDGAVLVGRIDAIDRTADGLIRARGVLDLGSELGREATRLVRGGFLSGVSMDLDEVNQSTTRAGAGGVPVEITRSGRVRAATLVAIPAFDEARIALVDDPLRPTRLIEIHGFSTAREAGCGCPSPTEPNETGDRP